MTHALVGAAASSWTVSADKFRAAMGAGALAALVPDLDVLLTRSSDPLYQLELHRQFSHSLLFAPVGALVVSLLLWRVARRWLSRRELYLATLAGFFTAGFLDACTSYGTQLLWPFSPWRIAWNLTPVVEPFFTLVLLGLAIASTVTGRRVFQAVAALVVVLFLANGALQQARALKAVGRLHEARGHHPDRVLVKPTLGNQVLWRVLYSADNRLYTDAVRTGFWASPLLFPGESLPLVNLERDFSSLAGSRTYRDFQRFSELSQGYLICHPDFPNLLGDGRYAMLPTSLKPLWGLEFDPEHPNTPPKFLTLRDSRPEVRQHFWDMLMGRD